MRQTLRQFRSFNVLNRQLSYIIVWNGSLRLNYGYWHVCMRMSDKVQKPHNICQQYKNRNPKSHSRKYMQLVHQQKQKQYTFNHELVITYGILTFVCVF